MAGIIRSPMTLLMLATFTIMVGVAATYPPDARFMPFVVGIPAIGLCLLQLVLDWRAGAPAPEPKDTRSELEKAEERVSKMVGRNLEFEVAHVAPEVVVIENSDEVAGNREFLIWGYIVGFIAAILVFGFNVSIPVFIAIFLWREAGYSLLKALVSSAVGSAILLGVFTWGLKLKLHGDFLTDWLF